MGLASPETTQSGNVPIGAPSAGASNMCCFMVSIERLRGRPASTSGSQPSTAAATESSNDGSTSWPTMPWPRRRRAVAALMRAARSGSDGSALTARQAIYAPHRGCQNARE